MPENRQLPEWSKDVKKWMGEAGAMSNLQRDFVFFLEDSIIQPLRKKMLKANTDKRIAEEKQNEYKLIIDRLTEEIAETKVELKNKILIINKLQSNEQQTINQATSI